MAHIMPSLDQALECASTFLQVTDDASKTWGIGVFVFDFLISALYFACGFFLLRTPSLEPRRLAWILSALTSMPCATISLYYVRQLIKNNWNTLIMYEDDRLSRFTVTFFIAFLVMDIVIGLKYYAKYIHPLSGWFHHFFYLCALTWSLQGHFTACFCMFLVEELPTFLLALGSIYPEYRADLGFGATFFVTRLAYHGLLLKLMLDVKEPRHTVWPIPAFAMFVHVFWFHGWIVSYRKALSKRRKAV